VALPGARAYERAPGPFNARFHDVRPQAAVRCAVPEDVSETVSFAARHGLQSAARSGGHCFAGHSSTRGLLIDVAPIASVSLSGDVATIGAGARLGDIYDELQQGGRAIAGGSCPSVGIAGLTLGGGLGILGRLHGVTSDSLVGATVVTADGRLVQCDERHHADLFWALRGGGAGSFGVVTSLDLSTVPAAPATNVHARWRIPEAMAVVQGWLAWAPDAPDDLSASLKLTVTDDPDEPPSVDLYAAAFRSESEAATLVDDLLVRVGVEPAAVSSRHMSFAATRRFWAELGVAEDGSGASPHPAPDQPRHLVAESEFFRRSLPPDAITALVDNLMARRVSGESRELDLIPWGGAYNRVRPDATAFVHREERFQIKHAAVVDPSAPTSAKAAAHGWVARSWGLVHPWGSGRVFQNFADPDLVDWATAYFGPNLDRLVQVKARYDPANVFRFPQSVPVR
jgi:FAD/FMN-containing dehydrogenase